MQERQLKIATGDMRQVEAPSVPERMAGLVARVFGCWHREMSRPFSHEGQAYRVCLNCGAQRKFNLSRWETQGAFYFNRPTQRLTNGMELVAGAN